MFRGSDVVDFPLELQTFHYYVLRDPPSASLRILSARLWSEDSGKYLNVTLERIGQTMWGNEVSLGCTVSRTDVVEDLETDVAALADPDGLLSKSHLKRAKALDRSSDPGKFQEFCLIHQSAHCIILSNYDIPEGCDFVVYDSSLGPYTEDDWNAILQMLPQKRVLHLAFAGFQQQIGSFNCGPFMILSSLALNFGVPPQKLCIDEWKLRPLLIKVMRSLCSVQALVFANASRLRDAVYTKLLAELPSTFLSKIGWCVDISNLVNRLWCPVRVLQRSSQRSVLASVENGELRLAKHSVKSCKRRMKVKNIREKQRSCLRNRQMDLRCRSLLRRRNMHF